MKETGPYLKALKKHATSPVDKCFYIQALDACFAYSQNKQLIQNNQAYIENLCKRILKLKKSPVHASSLYDLLLFQITLNKSHGLLKQIQDTPVFFEEHCSEFEQSKVENNYFNQYKDQTYKKIFNPFMISSLFYLRTRQNKAALSNLD